MEQEPASQLFASPRGKTTFVLHSIIAGYLYAGDDCGTLPDAKQLNALIHPIASFTDPENMIFFGDFPRSALLDNSNILSSLLLWYFVEGIYLYNLNWSLFFL